MNTTAPAADPLADAGPTISVSDFAQLFDLDSTTVYRLARRDELGVRVLRIGRSLRIPTADVRRLLGEQSVQADHQEVAG